MNKNRNNCGIRSDDSEEAEYRTPSENSEFGIKIIEKIRNFFSSIHNPQSTIPNGFTLMELMVVIAIIVLLAGIMVPNLANRLERAKITKTETDIASIEGAIAMYETDLGVYPPSFNLNGIDYLDTCLTGRDKTPTNPYNPSDNPNWHGPYIKGIAKDPWGNDYVYLKNTCPRPGSPPTCLPIANQDYPNNNFGGSVNAPVNLSYYIYSKGKNRDTGTVATSKDDINNWDVNKSWREAK